MSVMMGGSHTTATHLIQGTFKGKYNVIFIDLSRLADWREL